MKQFLRHTFSPVGTAGRRRRRRPAVLTAAVVLLWWLYVAVGANLPWLLAGVAAALTAVWVTRAHPQVAVCALIALVTAAVPAVVCVILISQQVIGAGDVGAVLTGYVLAAPVPALVACALRPALINAGLNALLGSTVLLLAAVPCVVLGDHGESAVVLIVALTSAVGLIWHRHRRASGALLAALPVVNGWTDLGSRVLPDGCRVDRLLVGLGHAIACSDSTSSATPEQGALAAARTAAAAAAAIGLPGARVQPVVVTDRETAGLERHLVNDGKVAASVIVTGRYHLEDVTRLAPRRYRSHRRAVLTAALLPIPAMRAAEL